MKNQLVKSIFRITFDDGASSSSISLANLNHSVIVHVKKGERKMKKTFFLISLLVLSFSAVVEAVPIEYTMTGHIRETVNGTSRFWDMTGSLLLSDPTIEFYGSLPYVGSSWREENIYYTLTDIVFKTDAFELNATGRFRLRYGTDGLNFITAGVDNYYYLYMDDYHSLDEWGSSTTSPNAIVLFYDQSPYAQPDRIHFLDNYRLSSDISGGPLYNIFIGEAIRTASVPEPTTLILLSCGLVGLFAWRKMFRHMMGDLSN